MAEDLIKRIETLPILPDDEDNEIFKMTFPMREELRRRVQIKYKGEDIKKTCFVCILQKSYFYLTVDDYGLLQSYYGE